MRHKRARLRIGLLTGFLLVVVSALYAQDQTIPDPHFMVEVIVFAREVPPERYYRHPGEPVVGRAIDLLERFDLEREFPLAAAGHSHGQTTLVQPSTLTDVWQTLQSRSDYRPLAWQAWEQPAEPFGAGRGVRLHGDHIVEMATPNLVSSAGREEHTYEVDGVVRFELGRFFHLAVDLAYRRPQSAVTQRRQGALRSETSFDTDRTYQTHRIVTRGRVNLDRPVYFDHAQFGVIAVVRAVESTPTTN